MLENYLTRFILSIFLLLSVAAHAESVPSPLSLTRGELNQIDWDKWLTQTKAPIYQYQIIKTYPHSTQSFTEGLFYDKGHVYESSGLYTESNLQEIELTSGKIIKKIKLPATIFGEGTTALNGKIYQLSYESNIGFIYNLKDFSLIKTFHFPGQGWGLTNDGRQLLISDGSASILFIDPHSFKLNRYIVVHDGNQAIGRINELEYINGKIYANIFDGEIIAIISPVDGKIEGWINLKGINPSPDLFTGQFVMNGIAYRPEKKTLLVTGKCWPYLYEIEIKK